MDGLSGLDAKTLLIGDIGENGSWWTGKVGRNRSETKRKNVGESLKKTVSSRTSNIHWAELASWYDLVHTADEGWQKKLELLISQQSGLSAANVEDVIDVEDVQDELADARDHAVRTLLKITENMLKRPSRPMKEPGDLRFLLILLSNPSLYPSTASNKHTRSNGDASKRTYSGKPNGAAHESPRKSPGREGSQHNGLLKRIFGLLAHSPEICHRYLVGWFTRFDEQHLVKTVDLVASFVTHRIARRSGRPRRKSVVHDGGLIPDLSGSTMSTSAQLHSAMGLSGSVKKPANDPNAEPDWVGDWQIKAAAKVMSLLFAANNVWQGKRRESSTSSGITPPANTRGGQLLHTSSFYNTLLDYQDLIADFRVWETRRDKFAFCQYPLFLSMGAKIKILEHDARRQMEIKAREAYFDQVIRQRAIDGHFTLRVRRECMVDDSLRQISAAVGAGQEELKKGLRVQFTGEEGVDAGGPRKEWFLMLVRDIFDPNHGMFSYDDESNTCYFNPNSFETSDQYYLVGALLGLAIYNSTILDVALPPFAFRKLLAAAPASVTNATNVSTITGTKGQMTYNLTDLAEYRPSLAAGLQQLLDFEGDVESTYCRDFVAAVERYGTIIDVPLKPNGENTPVTNTNRQEFVDAYVRYLLDVAVARQFEPFKRGFFTVCAGNALSLFRAEEIELLIRGSDEALDVDSLRAVAVYENWRHTQDPHHLYPNPAQSVPVIGWFWESFAEASPMKQRKLLTFITGTDRIPAVGATSLVLRVVAGGDGWGGGLDAERQRFPVARTCFNMVILWRYENREQLEEKLWRAVDESEGFGLK
jgi:E3 ubiquitin-protein ligase HECTD2